MMDWIQSHLLITFGPLGLIAALAAAVKYVPLMLEERATKALEHLFVAGDAADDAFLVAAIQYAEAKYGAGTGKQKAEAVVAKIMSLMPLQYRYLATDKVKAKAVELFQQSFDRLEAVALKAIKDNGTAKA